MYLKPKSSSVNIIYECPQCSSKHWYSDKELNQQRELECCGQIHQLQPIRGIKLVFKKSKQNFNEAHKVLKQYGYSKDQIDSAEIDANTQEEFVKEFLALQMD